MTINRLVQYNMRGQLIQSTGVNPYQDVLWTVYNTPDLTGQFSGYFGQLQNIVIDSTLVLSPCSSDCATPAGGDLSGCLPDPLVIGLFGVPINPVPAPTEGNVLTFHDGYWEAQPNSGQSVSNNIVYVSNNGNDTTGDGSFFKPWATIAKANSYLTTVQTGSGHVQSVMFYPGTWTENWTVLPNVSYTGLDPARGHRVAPTMWSGAITLDSTWSQSQYSASVSYITNGIITGGYIFDFSSATGVSQPGGCINMYNIEVFSGTTCELISNDGLTNGLNLFLTLCIQHGNSPLTVTSADLNSSHTEFHSLLTLTTTGSAARTAYASTGGDQYGAGLTLNGVLGEVLAVLESVSYIGVLTLNGTNIILNSGIGGWNIGCIPNSIILQNGASYPVFDGLLPAINIQPSTTNGYVVTTVGGNSVWAPSTSVVGSPSNILYVAKNGNDTTGTGTFFAPYATYGKCVSTIGGSAGESNLYTVVFAPGNYTETIQLAPFIFINGLDPDLTTVLSGIIDFGSNFTGVNDITGLCNVECTQTVASNAAFFSFANTTQQLVITNAVFDGHVNVVGHGLSSSIATFTNVVFNAASTELHDATYNINQCTFGQELIVEASSANQCQLIAQGGAVRGSTVILGNNGKLCAVLALDTALADVTLTGTNALLTTNIGGIPAAAISTTGGASLSQVTVQGVSPTVDDVLTWTSSGCQWKASGGGNSIGQLTGDVTAGPASTPDQSVAGTVVSAQNTAIVFATNGVTTWDTSSTFTLNQGTTTSTPAAASLWQPQQSTHANPTGGNALINLQNPVPGSGAEAQLWITRGSESDPRVAAGTITGNTDRGMLWLTNGTNALTYSNYAIGGDGGTFVSVNTTQVLRLVLNDSSVFQYMTVNGNEFFGATAAFGSGTGIFLMNPASVLPTGNPGISDGQHLIFAVPGTSSSNGTFASGLPGLQVRGGLGGITTIAPAGSVGTLNTQLQGIDRVIGTAISPSAGIPTAHNIIVYTTPTDSAGLMTLKALCRATANGTGVALGDSASAIYYLTWENVGGTVTNATLIASPVYTANFGGASPPVIALTTSGATITLTATVAFQANFDVQLVATDIVIC